MDGEVLRQVDAGRGTEAGEVAASYQLDAKIRLVIPSSLTIILTSPRQTPGRSSQ